MSRKRIYCEAILPVVLFILVVLFLTSYGRAHRVFLDTPRIKALASPVDAYAVWKDAGVHGRILLLFDRQLNAAPVDRRLHILLDESLLTPDNYIYFAADQNLIREIYHVIPDPMWDEVSNELHKWPLVVFSNGFFRMAHEEGVPVLIMRARDLPVFKEKVLVTIHGRYWGEDGINTILDMMKDNRWRSDCLTLAGPNQEKLIKKVQDFYATSR